MQRRCFLLFNCNFVASCCSYSEQEAFEDDSRQRDEEQCRMDAHDGEWERIQRMDTNCNTMQ